MSSFARLSDSQVRSSHSPVITDTGSTPTEHCGHLAGCWFVCCSRPTAVNLADSAVKLKAVAAEVAAEAGATAESVAAAVVEAAEATLEQDIAANKVGRNVLCRAWEPNGCGRMFCLKHSGVGQLTSFLQQHAGNAGCCFAAPPGKESDSQQTNKLTACSTSSTAACACHVHGLPLTCGVVWRCCVQAIGAAGAAALLSAVASRGKANRRPGGKLAVLTHCNTGSLATAGYGTALGVVRALHEQGKLERCYACETRPYNQGEGPGQVAAQHKHNAHCCHQQHVLQHGVVGSGVSVNSLVGSGCDHTGCAWQGTEQ